MHVRTHLALIATALISLACLCGGPSPGTGQWTPGAVAGPFTGPNGVSYYTDPSGRLTLMDGTGVVYLAQPDGNIVYARDAWGGWYTVAGQNMSPVGGMPAEAATWPVAAQIPVAQAAPQGGYTGYGAQGGGYDPGTMQIMMDMNNSYHDTSMTIIDNMASDPVDYYTPDYQYVGSW